MEEEKHWQCPNCGITCAIEIKCYPENIVWCICNNSLGKCDYNETVSETKKRLKEAKINLQKEKRLLKAFRYGWNS